MKLINGCCCVDGVYLFQVDLFGQTPRLKDNGEIDKNAPPRPAFAKGEIELSISRQTKKLDVNVIPHKNKVKPGLYSYSSFFY